MKTAILIWMLIVLLSCREKTDSKQIEKTDTLDLSTYSVPGEIKRPFVLLSKYDSIRFEVNHGKLKVSHPDRMTSNNFRFVKKAIQLLDSSATFCSFIVTLRYVQVQTPDMDTLNLYPHHIEFTDNRCNNIALSFKEKSIPPRFINTEIYPATCFYFPGHSKLELLVVHELVDSSRYSKIKEVQHFLDVNLAAFPLTR